MDNYNPNTVYVLFDTDFDGEYLRIVSESENCSVSSFGGDFFDSGMTPNEETMNFLLKIGYEIIQEWN